MSHKSREKLDLVNRSKKVIGQLESVLRALNEDDPCAEVLQRLSTARGAINSLMAELMEDHIRNHMPRNSKSSEEAADDVIQIVRTYLKLVGRGSPFERIFCIFSTIKISGWNPSTCRSHSLA